jgi:dUTP pyrophosphatase
VSPYYELSIYVSDPTLKQKYLASAAKHNALFHDATIDESDKYYDAGFDLFVPTEQVVEPGTTACINHAITCAMLLYDPRTYTYTNTSYYLYVRSSTATKTPLRLANSVGIIDAGYRGHIIAAFDHNCLGKGKWHAQPFTIEPYQRLVQLCPPNLSLPFCVRLVDSLADLGGFSDSKNGRGIGGFGSTGY